MTDTKYTITATETHSRQFGSNAPTVEEAVLQTAQTALMPKTLFKPLEVVVVDHEGSTPARVKSRCRSFSIALEVVAMTLFPSPKELRSRVRIERRRLRREGVQ